jgi:hypothetical protein
MSYSGFMKKALIREEGYPVGVPAPMYLVCICGKKVSMPERGGVFCECGTEYSASGWIVKRPGEPKTIKTRKQWGESRQNLNEFLQVGDLVDEDMADYFLCVLPPATHLSALIQVGEPYSHVNGRPTFPTIKKTAEGWQYRGNCHIRQTSEPIKNS